MCCRISSVMSQECSKGVRGCGRAGFTVLELTVAIVIVTTGLFGVIQMYRFGMDITRTLRDSAVALEAVENELEALRARPFQALENAEDAPFVTETPTVGSLFGARGTVTIRDYGEGSLRLKSVTATLSWISLHGRGMTQSVTTLVADQDRG